MMYPKESSPFLVGRTKYTSLTTDGSGVVEAVGDEVTLFKVGDRVAPVFPQGHDYVSIECFYCIDKLLMTGGGYGS
jgi:NADPH:quinone reductase-like Zn-dependent oxidoreductase